MDIGYARVSTDKQHLENQVHLLLEKGIAPEHVYYDEDVSGTVPAKNRPGFREMWRTIEANTGKINRLYIFEVSRLGRGFIDTLMLMQEIEKDRGIMVISLSPKETWLQTEDTGIRSLLMAVFSWVAERELETLKERIKIGLDRARREGKVLGRPAREVQWGDVRKYRELKDAKGNSQPLSWASIARILEIPESSFYRMKNRWEQDERTKRVKGMKKDGLQ
jgi:putative DNA-invertase from lambdoid prophage Rac